jgi:type I restriction enzyme M protein
MERFDFGSQIARMAEKDLLYLVINRFASIDLSPARVDTRPDGLCLRGTHPDRGGTIERRGRGTLHAARGDQTHGQSSPLPGEGPRPQPRRQNIYDPACGTGGMLSVSEKYIHALNADAQPKLFGQDWNDEA